jgi:hypothetical protein
MTDVTARTVFDPNVFDCKGSGMNCHQCGSAHQRGRFCNRCGSKRPPTAPPTGTWAVRTATIRSRAVESRDLYDTALARETAVGESPLERYLSVLLATPGSA